MTTFRDFNKRHEKFRWCCRKESNLRPTDYESNFLAISIYGALKSEVQHFPGGNVWRWERNTNT